MLLRRWRLKNNKELPPMGFNQRLGYSRHTPNLVNKVRLSFGFVPRSQYLIVPYSLAQLVTAAPELAVINMQD